MDDWVLRSSTDLGTHNLNKELRYLILNAQFQKKTNLNTKVKKILAKSKAIGKRGANKHEGSVLQELSTFLKMYKEETKILNVECDSVLALPCFDNILNYW